MKEERREYFRIFDEIALDYQLLDEAAAEQLREQLKLDMPTRFTAASSFAATSRQMAHLMHKIEAESSELGRCIQAIDEKLNMLARLFVAEEFDSCDQSAREVNISAGGLAFVAQNEVAAGTMVKLRMVLFPSLIGVLSLARVVHCERVPNGDLPFPWQVAVEYEELRESDRELLVRHVMALQTDRRRKERLEV